MQMRTVVGANVSPHRQHSYSVAVSAGAVSVVMPRLNHKPPAPVNHKPSPTLSTVTITDEQPPETADDTVNGRGPRGRLLPGSNAARQMAQRSVEARRRNADTATDTKAEVGLRKILDAVVDGSAPVTDKNLPALIRVLHDVIRLERGQATSISERVDVVAELRDLLPTLQLRAGDVQVNDGDPPSSSTI